MSEFNISEYISEISNINKLYIVPSKFCLEYNIEIKKYYDKMFFYTKKYDSFEIEYVKYDRKKSHIYFIIADNVNFIHLIDLINELDEELNFNQKFVLESIYYINKKIIDSQYLRTWIAYNDIKWKHNLFTIWQLTDYNKIYMNNNNNNS